MTVLSVTVPDQYFCTKHPDLNITARENKNQAGTRVPAYGEIFTSVWITLRYLWVLWGTSWYFWLLWGTSKYVEVCTSRCFQVFIGTLRYFQVRWSACRYSEVLLGTLRYLLVLWVTSGFFEVLWGLWFTKGNCPLPPPSRTWFLPEIQNFP